MFTGCSMKTHVLVAIAAIGFLAAGCKQQPEFQDPFTRTQIDWRPSLVLGTGDAARILGNQSRLEKLTAYQGEGAKAYLSAFRDDWRDPKTGKTGILYYMYEEYLSAEAAKSYLAATLKANDINPADGIRSKSGAELHYLTGGEVVRMAMVLKGNRLIRLKVNQVTSRYRLDEFKDVVGEFANQL
jgi:hypothetical protein